MDAPADAGIYAREAPLLDRWIQIGVAGQKVISLSVPDTPEDHENDHQVLDLLDSYLEGEAINFGDVDVGLTVPTDRRNVLEAVRQVPHGQNATVEQIARMVPGMEEGNEDDAATVRAALADNPVPIVIPDHRIRDGPSALPPDVERTLRSLESL